VSHRNQVSMAMFYLVSPLLDCERALLSFTCTPFNTTPHTPGHFTEAFHQQWLTFILKFKNVTHTPHYNDHCCWSSNPSPTPNVPIRQHYGGWEKRVTQWQTFLVNSVCRQKERFSSSHCCRLHSTVY
jgi:hypothetical protein